MTKGIRSTDSSMIEDRRNQTGPAMNSIAKFGSALRRARWGYGGPSGEETDHGVGEGGGGGGSGAYAQAVAIAKQRTSKRKGSKSIAEAMR